jgi:biopolymer transport protein ExbD
MKTHQKIVFKSDPAIQRDNDRYTVKIGDGNTLEVKPDGSILLNGTLWRRVVGYTQDDAQKNRFMAAIVIMPLLNLNWYAPDDIKLILPRGLNNAERDSAILKGSIIWIPSNDEIYVGSERIPKADFASTVANKIDELLKRQAVPNGTLYIVASINVDYGTVVNAIRAVPRQRVSQVGLIVEGSSGSLANRFLLQIPPLRDPNEDLGKLKPSPLPLGVVLSRHLELKLIRGGIADASGHFPIDLEPYGKLEAKGTLNDPSGLTQTLAQIFQKRTEQHVYKASAARDAPEHERVEKTVVIRAYRSCRYGDLIKIIDVIKGAGANPIVLQVDDLP